MWITSDALSPLRIVAPKQLKSYRAISIRGLCRGPVHGSSLAAFTFNLGSDFELESIAVPGQ
jgi:hypothetical protein